MTAALEAEVARLSRDLRRAKRLVWALQATADLELVEHLLHARLAWERWQALERQWVGSWNLALTSPAWRYRHGAPLEEIRAAESEAYRAISPAQSRLVKLSRGER